MPNLVPKEHIIDIPFIVANKGLGIQSKVLKIIFGIYAIVQLYY